MAWAGAGTYFLTPPLACKALTKCPRAARGLALPCLPSDQFPYNPAHSSSQPATNHSSSSSCSLPALAHADTFPKTPLRAAPAATAPTKPQCLGSPPAAEGDPGLNAGRGDKFTRFAGGTWGGSQQPPGDAPWEPRRSPRARGDGTSRSRRRGSRGPRSSPIYTNSLIKDQFADAACCR